MQVSLDFIKRDYIGLVRRYLPYCKDIDKLLNVKFIRDNTLGSGACADLENNTIIYGPNADEITIFHELEHIRKGPLVRNYEEDIRIDGNTGKIKIRAPRYGVFLDEAITECLAQILFKQSKNFQPQVDNAKLECREFYKINMGIISSLCKALNLNTLELCKLIELKHHSNDDTIDRIFSNLIDGVKFSQLEFALDKYETAHYIDYQCAIGGIEGKGCSEETKEDARKALINAYNVLERIIKTRTNTSRVR